MTAEGATFPGQDTPDTAALRARAADPHASLLGWRTVLALCDALDAATARAEAAERNARTAWDVHSEHVDMMNRRLLHERAVRDEAQGQRDRARGTAAALEAELARVIAETGWRDCAAKKGECDTRCPQCGCCEHDYLERCTCTSKTCGCREAFIEASEPR